MPADVRYSDLFTGPDDRLPLDAALVPFVERSPEGEPPVAPDLVRRARMTRQVRVTPTRAGRTRAAPLQTRARSSIDLGWSAVTLEQRNSLLAFFLGDLDAASKTMFVRIDGPDADPVAVQLDAMPAEEQLDKGVYRITATATEVFA